MTQVKVDMTGLPGAEVSNLAAFGWQFTLVDSGTVVQLVGLRGVNGSPRLHMRAAGRKHWANFGKLDDKWTCDGTRESFLRMVRLYLRRYLENELSEETV